MNAYLTDENLILILTVDKICRIRILKFGLKTEFFRFSRKHLYFRNKSETGKFYQLKRKAK